MSDTAMQTRAVVRELDPALDEAAASILQSCAAIGSVDRARDTLTVARNDDASTPLGVFDDDRLAGVYILRRIELMNEVNFLAVAEPFRRRGHGRMCLYDALLRSGRRPLVVDTDEAALAFYKSVGFKLVGKRKAADGSIRYRLGWHAPMPHPSGNGVIPC